VTFVRIFTVLGYEAFEEILVEYSNSEIFNTKDQMFQLAT
jgi:hypothetical protein